MFHCISIVIQGSTVIGQVISYAIKLNMWHENKYARFKFDKGNLSKYSRQRWRTLHLIDIDQVKKKYFLEQNTKSTSRVSGIINNLDISLIHCFM